MARFKLLTDDRGQSKLIKGRKYGAYNVGLSLLPHTIAGHGNLCPSATAGCIFPCLNTSGRGAMSSVQVGRQRRTDLLFGHPAEFDALLRRDLDALLRFAAELDVEPVCRLNVFSDLPWEVRRPWIFTEYPNVQFYDYTKIRGRMRRFLTDDTWPQNYHLTFSRSELNEEHCRDVIALGGQVAVVFRREPFPVEYLGVEVVNGDRHDLRHRDPQHCVIGLRAKGKARKAPAGFVVDN